MPADGAPPSERHAESRRKPIHLPRGVFLYIQRDSRCARLRCARRGSRSTLLLIPSEAAVGRDGASSTNDGRSTTRNGPVRPWRTLCARPRGQRAQAPAGGTRRHRPEPMAGPRAGRGWARGSNAPTVALVRLRPLAGLSGCHCLGGGGQRPRFIDDGLPRHRLPGQTGRGSGQGSVEGKGGVLDVGGGGGGQQTVHCRQGVLVRVSLATVWWSAAWAGGARWLPLVDGGSSQRGNRRDHQALAPQVALEDVGPVGDIESGRTRRTPSQGNPQRVAHGSSGGACATPSRPAASRGQTGSGVETVGQVALQTRRAHTHQMDRGDAKTHERKASKQAPSRRFRHAR